MKLSNGQILRGTIRTPHEGLKAVILLIYGLGEHIQRYIHWAEMFNNKGIGFICVDLPGHGFSDGRRGHISSYSILSEMVDIMTDECRKVFPGVPVFLYGHSMGGTILLNYLIHKKPVVKGAIVTSPWLRLSFEPDKAKLKLAAVMKYIVPGLTLPAGLEPAHLSHDKDVVKKYINDPMVNGKLSIGLFNIIINTARDTMANASGLVTPVLLIHGSDDMITSPEASRELAGKSVLVELKIWDGGYHELHNEPFKEDVFSLILEWMENGLKEK